MIDPCEDPQVIPPPPVDCSEATGVLNGSVLIDAGDDPSILEGVVRVEGSLRIYDTALTNLDFMACVQEVTEDVTIVDNDALTDVQGLWSLTTIGTDFIFSQNDAIEVFDGLPHLEEIVGYFVLGQNASLRRIDGFHRLERIRMFIAPDDANHGGDLLIEENPVLERIDGLIGLRGVDCGFRVDDNPMLCQSAVQPVIDCLEHGPESTGWCGLAEPITLGDPSC